MKYIGLIGHRGSGKETFARLIAFGIEELINRSEEDFDKNFEIARDTVLHTEGLYRQTGHCSLDSFGEIVLDNVKMLVPSTSCYDLRDSYVLNSNLIRMSDMSITSQEHKLPDIPILTSDEYFNRVISEKVDAYMTLGDLVIFVGDKVLKTFLGQDIFVKQQSLFSSVSSIIPGIKIYYDIKTDAEYDFIKNNDGLIIELECRSRAKCGGYMTLTKVEPDYKVKVFKNFIHNNDSLKDLCRFIIDKFNVK